MTDLDAKRDVRFEVSSDGRTVWVNSGAMCVARFGLTGHELYSDSLSIPAFLYAKPHAEGRPCMEDWLAFMGRVFDTYKVAIGDEHRPPCVQTDD